MLHIKDQHFPQRPMSSLIMINTSNIFYSRNEGLKNLQLPC